MKFTPAERARIREAIMPSADPTNPDNGIVKRCRQTSWHRPHECREQVGGQTHFYLCPGIHHDHDTRCCLTHGHHVSPHNGCGLR